MSPRASAEGAIGSEDRGGIISAPLAFGLVVPRGSDRRRRGGRSGSWSHLIGTRGRDRWMLAGVAPQQAAGIPRGERPLLIGGEDGAH
jgi:hypothetical protein